MSSFFRFEADFVQSLRCIPMQVRFKLDTCGVKLKLDQWSHFNRDDRQVLVDRPCASPSEITAYRECLQQLIHDRTGQTATDLPIDPEPAWLDPTQLPTIVQAQAESVGHPLQLAQWQSLTPLERFVLLKLSRSSHENSNFLPALEEFNLLN
jgi:hypothetical protein